MFVKYVFMFVLGSVFVFVILKGKSKIFVFMKSLFVFVLGFVFVFVILKGKFIDLKLVFLISVFVFVYDLRLGRMEWGPWSLRGTTGWVWSWKKHPFIKWGGFG